MGKVVLAFVAGVLAGWLVAVATRSEPPAPESPPPSPPPSREPSGAARRPRMHAPPPVDAGGSAPAAGDATTTTRAAEPPPPEKVLTDSEISALLTDAAAASRWKGLNAAASRGLLSVAQLLDRARADPDRSVQYTALQLAVGRSSEEDGTMALAAAEVLAWARGSDPDRRSAGLQLLAETGARGAGLGRELLDAGGLPDDVYESAIRTLVAARQFDRLVAEPLDDGCREVLMNALSEALDDDASLGPRVVAVLREAGPPASVSRVDGYCRVAIQAGAPALVRDFVKSPSAPAEARALALVLLIENETQAASVVGLAEDVLTDASTPPGVRRRILEAAGSWLVRADAPGLAVLRRVRDHDPNVWVRALAAEYVSDAESR